MNYQFFAKAPYTDIFTMPYKYLFDCQPKFAELHTQMFQSLASIFLPNAGTNSLNESLNSIVKANKR